MEVIYGLALMSASILLLFYCARLRNGPSAPAWTQSNVFVQTVLFSTVVGVVFGFSMLIAFGAHMSDSRFGMMEVGLLVATAAATWACWYAIQKMPVPHTTAGTDPTSDLPPAANNHGPMLRTGRKTAGKTSKAA